MTLWIECARRIHLLGTPMSGRSIRPLGLALGLVFFAASPLALSQVTVHVTTAPVNGGSATDCTMTTDGNGLSLVQGSTDLRATGVTFTPAGCGQGTAVLPPTPNGFALNGVASSYGTVPATATVTWSVQNATSCVGLATLNGTGTTLVGWTDTTASSPQSRTVTFPSAGTYVLAMQCSNSANPPVTITSGAVMTTVSQGGGGGGGGTCQGPAGLTRLTTSDIAYGSDHLTQVRARSDTTEWINIWGYGSVDPAEHQQPWPGLNGSGPVIKQFGRTNFLAAHFNTGSSPMYYGRLTDMSNIGGPDVDIVLSQTCGDFSQNATYPGCSRTMPSDGTTHYNYFSNGGTAGDTNCPLQLNTDYYLNIRFHDPNSTVECAAGAAVCPLYTLNYWARWPPQ
jgi:hypothetical protein